MPHKEYEKTPSLDLRMAPALWELVQYKYCVALESLATKNTKQVYFQNLTFNLVP